MNSEPNASAGTYGTPQAPEPGAIPPDALTLGSLAPGAPLPDPLVTGEPEAGPLPVMPGFREMAVHSRADEQAARMAEDRSRLVRALAEQRQAAGLSQTEVAARMGTSQSAVARLEAGPADVRASTLERYAAAVGSQITWKLSPPDEGARE
jgi:predicted XRE-type DNA-binding protein